MIQAVAILLALILNTAAHAHGGVVDGLGCHHNRKAAGYHCHRGALAGQSFASKSEAVTRLRQPPIPSQPIVGTAQIIDGDTITVAMTRIRLDGIDAPETKQSCSTNGKQWRCGQQSTTALRRIIGSQRVHCRAVTIDKYSRVVAFCNIGGPDGADVNAAMVQQGWALAYRRYSTAYVGQERAAREAKAGIWRGEFVAPWDWRRGKRLSAANDNEPGQCLIKGNISRSGRIYHVPGGQYYSRTKINQSRGERWFCSEAEARDAGWRRSKR